MDTTQTGSEGSRWRTLYYVDTMVLEFFGALPATPCTVTVHFIAQEVRSRRFSRHSRQEFKLDSADPFGGVRLNCRSDPLSYSRDKPHDKTASPKSMRFGGWVIVMQPRRGQGVMQASSAEVLAWFDKTRPGNS